jgi:serine carboxypeptidase-like clade 2
MISDEIFLAISHSCDFEDYTFNEPHNESKSCNDAISEANTIVGEYVNNYDVILDVCYPSIVMQELRLRKYVCVPLMVQMQYYELFDSSCDKFLLSL